MVKLSPDQTSAQVRPQLRYAAVLERLDETLGTGGWSNTYTPLEANAFICSLSTEEVVKSVVVTLTPERDATQHAQDALVYAAELLGLKPPADPNQAYWVDYNPEAGEPLFEPAVTPEVAPEAPPLEPPPVPEKPAGQQAIDRIVDRLREQGLGLEAAKLLVAHGGYGSDPQAAKELYANLRSLLLRKEAAGPS